MNDCVDRPNCADVMDPASDWFYMQKVARVVPQTGMASWCIVACSGVVLATKWKVTANMMA